MKVPTRTAIGVLPTNQALRGPGVNATAEAFGAGIGERLNQVAGQTMALGAFVKEQETQKARFTALRDLSVFETNATQALEEAKRTNTPGSTDFYGSAAKQYQEMERKFLAENVPADLQDEFKVRTADLGGRLSLNAMSYQYQTNDDYFKQGIQDTIDDARNIIAQDATRETLQSQRARIDETIAASGLSTAEKVQAGRIAYKGIEGVAYRQAQVQRLRDESSGVGSDVTQVTDLLIAQGQNEESAAAQAAHAAGVAEQAFGSIDTWSHLPQRTRAALISVIAKDGNISNEMVRAVQDGNQEDLAAELRKQGYGTEGDLIQNPAANIDDDPVFSNLPYEDRLTLTRDAEREVAAEVTAQTQAQKAQDASLVNALKVGLYDGTAGQADIDTMREKNILTDYEDIKAAEDILAKRDSNLVLKQLAQNMLDGKVTFAPGNEDHMKALNAYVGPEGIQALEQKDSAYAANTLVPLIQHAQGIPSDVVDQLRGMIRSPDPEKALWALDLMSVIERTSQKAFDQVPEADRKNVDFYQARKGLMKDEDLLHTMRGPVDPAEANARNGLRKQGLDLFNQNETLNGFDPAALFRVPGFIPFTDQSATNPGWKPAQEALFNDFQTLFLDNYEIYANVDQAKAAAAKQLTAVWGVTNVGADNHLMRHPPEMAYPTVANSHDWMEAQLRAEGAVLPNQQFQLIGDQQTDDEWGKGAPSYILGVEEDGVIKFQFDENGNPRRVNFSFGEAEQAAQDAWRERDRLDQEVEQQFKELGQSLQHELDTGTPPPDEYLRGFTEQNLGAQ